jgi:hypothetical protein
MAKENPTREIEVTPAMIEAGGTETDCADGDDGIIGGCLRYRLWRVRNNRTRTCPDHQSFSHGAVIAPLLISVHTEPVEHRGIRYTIRVRAEREQWSVAIYPEGIEMAQKVINGPRENAELLAHSMIKKWLEKRLP